MAGKRNRKSSRSPTAANVAQQKKSEVLAHELAHAKNIPQRWCSAGIPAAALHKPRGDSRPRLSSGATLRQVAMEKTVELRSTGQPGRLSPRDRQLTVRIPQLRMNRQQFSWRNLFSSILAKPAGSEYDWPST